MPRRTIDIDLPLEHLSILDENGKPDDNLEPEIPDDLLRDLFRTMLLGRRFDERLLNLQRQGRIGTFPPTTGQEAAQLGIVAALEAEDWMAPSFRETVAEIWRGKSMESVIIHNNGFGEGDDSDAAYNNLPVSVPVASQALHAVGIGWALKYRKSSGVAVTFFGDGATSEGDFHEAMNFAGVYQVPVIFVCQNNHWAISVPLSRQTRSKTLAQKAIAYGIPGVQVDGNDILAVYSAAREAVERARNGKGPTFIECVTYRLQMHTTADDPKRYRNDEEVDAWKKKDPLPRFKTYLIEKGIFSESDIETLEKSVQEDIQQAVDRAEQKMKKLGDPLAMFDHAYDELPPDLIAQRKYLETELSADAGEVPNG
jgi:pyruvate dehydrogenase E1 component alpha subunit